MHYPKHYFVLFLSSCILLSRLISSGFLSFTDNLVHVARMKLFPQVLSGGWIAGWATWDYAGFPYQTIKYQIPTWITVFFDLIFPTNVAYRLTLLLSIAFPAIAIYILAKNHVRKNTALLTALLFIIQSQVLVRTLEGMFAENIAVAFLALTLHALVNNKPKHAAGYYAATILSHPYAGVIASFAILFSAFQKGKPRQLIALLGAPLSFFFWANVLKERSWYLSFVNNVTATSTLTAMGFLVIKLGSTPLQTFFLSLPSTLAFVLAIYGCYQYKSWLKTYIPLFILSTIIATGFWLWMPGIKLLPIAGLAPDRFILFIRFFVVLFAASAMEHIKFEKLFIPITLLLLTTTAAMPSEWFATQEPPQELWDAVAKLEGEGRIAYEVCEGSPRMRSLSAHYTGRDFFGGWFGSNPVFPLEDTAREFFEHANTKEKMQNLTQTYGIRYVVSCSRQTANLLPPPIQGGIDYNIHDLGPTSLVHGAQAQITQEQNKYHIELNETQNETITLKVQYHPYWKATHNGEELPIKRTQDNLMEVEAKEGTTSFSFSVFSWKPSWSSSWELLLVPLLALAICFYI